MSAGGRSAILFLIAGIVMTSKGKQQLPENSQSSQETTAIENLPPLQIGSIYRQRTWEARGFEIGVVPPPPAINWGAESPFFPGKTLAETSVLIYVPKDISYQGQKYKCNPSFIVEHLKTKKYNAFFSGDQAGGNSNPQPGGQSSVEDKFGHLPIEAGWFLITKKVALVATKSCNQPPLLKGTGYRQPTIGEALLLALIHHADAEDLDSCYQSYTYSAEWLGKNPIAVWLHPNSCNVQEEKDTAAFGGVCPVGRF